MGHLNITAADFRGLVVAYLKAVIANNTWLESKLQRYVECVRGCSVSMIVGYACGDHGSRELSSISKEIMDFSLRRIEKFSYVGFQEYWESSVRLFLAKFGGNFSVELLYNSRKGHMEFTEEEESKVESLLNQPDAGFRDEYDEAPTTTPFHSTGRIRYLDNNKPINQ